MKIPIPEVEENFDSCEDALAHIVKSCRIIVDKAKRICTQSSVQDIPAYSLAFIDKVLVEASTLISISRQRKDYNTVCALVRILADNVATLNIVYNCENDEERVLRHLLYVLDGVSQRYELLEGHKMRYDGKIPKETYDALYLQVEGAKKNARGCIDFCVENIKGRLLYVEHKQQIDVLIERKNWKYKDMANPKDSFTWKELYGMLNINTGDEMFPYLSQYVHGLSVSNILLDDKDDFDAPVLFATCLIGWLWYYIRKVYEPHVGSYTLEDIVKKMT